ncbi:MAG: hypothetical protein E7327_02855 [Clostridiales bacterium]|nr:hypothetical protein [Clostridiales bacterium]
MKRDLDNLNLRGAFRPEPEACHAALMNAARSVREENEMKRASYRAVLIAALIIVSMMAVAFAAGGLTGWRDFFGEWHGTTGVPEGVYERMTVSEPAVWEVGPLTFTANELLTDGHIAISAVHVRTTDGSAALITGANTSDPVDPIRANGENGRALAARLGVSEDATWLEAAAQLNQPLYRVSADHDMQFELLDGAMMVEVLYNEDNSVTFFCMSMLDTERVGDVLNLPMCLDVALADPATGEGTERWRDYDQVVAIPVCPVLEERTYFPEKETVIGGHKLVRVDAVRYVTGAYLTFTYEMSYADVPESAYELYELQMRDEAGSKLPGGMSMTASMDFTITVEEMIGVDKLPDTLTLTDEVLPDTILPEAGVVLTAR